MDAFKSIMKGLQEVAKIKGNNTLRDEIQTYLNNWDDYKKQVNNHKLESLKADDLLFQYDDNPPTTIEDLFNLNYFYHGTYLPYLEEIKKLGYIKPGIHKNWDISEKFIYLTKDPDDAYDWAETAENVPEEYLDQIVVLKIDPKYLDINKLDIDHNQSYYGGDIDSDYPETWVQFEYNGEIPVKAIKEVIKDE